MSTAQTAHDLASGKGSTDENFPVASALIAPRHRPVVMAFYRFARAADDVADSATAPPARKLALLETLRAGLAGESDDSEEGRGLRVALEPLGLTPQHGLDLLEAFRRDVTKLRYADWDDLMDYCRYSASPVGRFVLDVHGEDPALWPMNDALCSALQVINHLQDCGKDRREIDRVYIPLDALAVAGVGVEALDAPVASAALRGVIASLTRQTQALLAVSRPFARGIRDGRLALEVGVIQALAEDLCKGLLARDPLSQNVHHAKPKMAALALMAMARTGLERLGRPAVSGQPDMAALEAKVAGSSFYAAMKLMPAKGRAGMFAIYAFCRAVDDIADDEVGSRPERAQALDAWRRDLDALYAGGDPGQAAFLVEAVHSFNLEKLDFLAVIDGMAMDVAGDIVAPDNAALDLYCDRVASAVGRLSVRVFGMERAAGIELSHHLGRALQLTNILRDLDEDAAIGRLYLSRESLDAAFIPLSDPKTIIADPRIDMAARVIAAKARVHYAAADRVMAAARQGQLRAPRLMRAAYGRILEHMQRQGWPPPRHRVSLSKLEKLWVVLRYGLLP